VWHVLSLTVLIGRAVPLRGLSSSGVNLAQCPSCASRGGLLITFTRAGRCLSIQPAHRIHPINPINEFHTQRGRRSAAAITRVATLGYLKKCNKIPVAQALPRCVLDASLCCSRRIIVRQSLVETRLAKEPGRSQQTTAEMFTAGAVTGRPNPPRLVREARPSANRPQLNGRRSPRQHQDEDDDAAGHTSYPPR
jgi:hypothetical protein